MRHRTTSELEAAIDGLRGSPADDGRLVRIVSRPAPGQREIHEVGELSLVDGLVGDSWSWRPCRRSADGGPHPEMQLNVINVRLADLIAAGDVAHAAMAGDQLHVDLDLSEANLPNGARLYVGDAVVEVTAQPHNGCKKFSQRFGTDAMRFVNSPVGRELRLRGINAKVVVAGTIRVGDTVKVERP